MQLKASYTVENSVIVPLFVIIVVILTRICFYMHDSVIVKNATLKLAVRTEFEENISTEEIAIAGEEYLREKTIYMKNFVVKIKDNFTTSEVTAKSTFLGKDVSKTTKINKNKPDDFIRLTNAFKITEN